jgi:hypothetical protein
MAGLVMAEVLLALLMFWTVVFFGFFLEKGRTKYAVGFSTVGTLGVLTKGNGVAVMLVPFAALMLSRRFHTLKSGRFWIMILSVLAACGPFYWATLDMARNGWQQSSPSMAFTLSAAGYYLKGLYEMAGLGVAVMAFIGVGVHLVMPSLRSGAQGRWSALGGLACSVVLIQCLIPCGLESRHLIPVASSIAVFTALGVAQAAQALTRFGILERSKFAVCLFLALLLVTWEGSATPKKSWSGFGEVAGKLLHDPGLAGAVFMVASDSTGEGVFVSEVAVLEENPTHILLRASKMLSNSRWDGGEYELVYDTPSEIMDFLKSVPVQIVVLDRSVASYRQSPHLRLLEDALQEYSHLWEPAGAYPVTRQGQVFAEGLLVYRLAGSVNSGTGRITFNMEKMLGRNLEKNL